ncbi:hypothetical protein [Paraglaciecola sp.]|uniref:hypothetical protein n=1 Tax=Paraglaciecola sp. TaxID=1920173 RepID=UPI003EF40E82
MRMLVLTLVMIPVIVIAQNGNLEGLPVEPCKDAKLDVISNVTTVKSCTALPNANVAYQMPNNTAGFCYIVNIDDSDLSYGKGNQPKKQLCKAEKNDMDNDWPSSVPEEAVILVVDNDKAPNRHGTYNLSYRKEQSISPLTFRYKSPDTLLASSKGGSVRLREQVSEITPEKISFSVVIDEYVNDITLAEVKDSSGRIHNTSQFTIANAVSSENENVLTISSANGSSAIPTNASYRIAFRATKEVTSKVGYIDVYLMQAFSVRDIDYLAVLLEYALALKLSADERYLTSTVNCDVNFSSAVVCPEYAEIRTEYLKACEQVQQFFKAPTRGSSSRRTDACDGADLSNSGGKLLLQRDKIDKNELATIDLLQADIKYRLGLLDRGLPFLGGYRSMSMTTPHQELVKLRALERRMSDAIDRIERLQERFANSTFEAQDVDVEIAYIAGQIQAEQINSEISSYQTSALSSDSQYYQQRKELLQNQIDQYAKKIDELAEAQENLNKSAVALIESGIASASGLPVTDIKALASGDLQTFAESYVKDQVLSAAGSYAKEFAESSELVASIAETIDDVQNTIEEVEAYKNDYDQVKKAIDGDSEAIKELAAKYGNEDVKKIITVGEKLESDIKRTAEFSKVLGKKRADDFLRLALKNRKVRNEIDRLVKDVMPVEAVLEDAYDRIAQTTDIKTRLSKLKKYEDIVDKAIHDFDDLNEKITSEFTRVDMYKKEIEDKLRQGIPIENLAYLQSTVEDVIKGLDDDKKKIDILLSFDQHWLMSSQPVKDLIAMVESSGYKRSQRDAIIKRLKYEFGGLANEPRTSREDRNLIKIEGGHISVEGVGTFLSEGLVNQYFKQKNLAVDEINAFFVNFKETTGKELEKEAVARIKYAIDGPKEALKDIQSRLSRSDNEKLWRKIESDKEIFKDSIQDAGRREVAKMLVSNEMLETAEVLPEQIRTVKTLQSVESSSGSLPSSSDTNNYASPGDTGLSPEANLALQTALNSALPGAGVALSLGQTWASMDANKDLMEDYSERLTDTIAEHEQITRSITEADRGAALADLERNRAVALRNAARTQLSEFNEQINNRSSDLAEIRQLLFLYRPYFFYLAELMRERFNAFDRSLALWSTGVGHAGYFNGRITEDPRNVRLALDSEIQLFTWLNRDGESTKSSPYYLFNHWQQLITMAENYCADYGCKPGDGKLGKISSTVPVKLFADLKGREAKQDFRLWKTKSSRDGTIEMLLSLTPEQRLIPQSVVNARILDINIVAIDKKGRTLPGNRVDVRHTGFSRVVLFDKDKLQYTMVDEQLLPSSMMPPSNEAVFDIRALRTRFQTQNDITELLALRNFEGYGVMGNYVLTIMDGPSIEEVDDFEIQISYTYQQPSDIRYEQDFIEYLTKGKECELEDHSYDKSSDDGKGYSCYFESDITISALKYDPTTRSYICRDAIASFNIKSKYLYPSLKRLQSLKCVTPKSTTTTIDPVVTSTDYEFLGRTRQCSDKELLTIVSLPENQRSSYTCFAENSQ